MEKVQGWKEKLLSRPGKEVLVKAGVQAIPTSMMSIFKISKGLIDEIHSILARFWWSFRGSERKIDIGVSLYAFPSLRGNETWGFEVFNHTLLAKKGRRLFMDSH